MNILAWNINGIGNIPSLKSLKKIIKSNKISCIAIFQPKVDNALIRDFLFKLNCVDYVTNQEGNISLLWEI